MGELCMDDLCMGELCMSNLCTQVCVHAHTHAHTHAYVRTHQHMPETGQEPPPKALADVAHTGHKLHSRQQIHVHKRPPLRYACRP